MFVLGEDDDLYAEGVEPAAVGARRERHRHDQLHLGHDRAAQGRADHPPQHLDQRRHLRAARRRHRPRRLPAHAADVPRQRLGHAVRDDRHGRAAGGAAQGRRRRDPAPGREVRRHGDVRRARGRRRRARRGRRAGTARSPAATGSGSSWPARRRRPRRSRASRPSWAGSSSRSTASPRPRRCSPSTARRAEWDDLDRRGARAPAGARRPARDRRDAARSTTRARCWPARNVVLEGYWDQPEETERGAGGRLVPHRRRRRHRRRRLPDHPGPQEGRDHHRRRERLLDRGRGRDLLPPRRRRGRRDRRARREVGRDDQGAGGEGRGLRRSPSRS